MIEDQIKHMTRMVDDLLDVSRITRGKVDLQKETIALAEVVDLAVEASRPLDRRLSASTDDHASRPSPFSSKSIRPGSPRCSRTS